MKTTLLSLTAFAASVAAHGAVTSYVIDGVTYPGYQGFSPSPNYAGIQMSWPDYNPSTATSASAKCNGGTSAPGVATVRPGSSIRALWAQWTHSPSTYAVYLYPCSSFPCSTTGANWFKIDEAGPLGSTVGSDNWAGDVIMKTGGYTSTLPAALPSGKYVIRHELVARHQANNPQFYAECAQIEVVNGGSGSIDSSYKVAIPSTAFADPSSNMLNFEVNGSTVPSSSYKVHGPPVWGKSGGGGATQAPVTTTVRTTTTQGNQQTTRPQQTTTTTRPQQTTTTTRAQTTTASNGGGSGAPLYGQCGGRGWAGATSCASGTCKFSNDYYSQCLP